MEKWTVEEVLAWISKQRDLKGSGICEVIKSNGLDGEALLTQKKYALESKFRKVKRSDREKFWKELAVLKESKSSKRVGFADGKKEDGYSKIGVSLDQNLESRISTCSMSNVLDEERAALLDSIPLLKELGTKIQIRLMNTATVKEFKNGDCLHKKNDPILHILVVKEGVLQLKDDDKLVSKLVSGDSFGEASLKRLTRSPVSVIAQGECKIWVIATKRMRDTLRKSKVISGFEDKRKAIKGDATADILKTKSLAPTNKSAKSDAEKAQIREALSHAPIFGNLQDFQLKEIAMEMWSIDVVAGRSLVVQGEPGDFFYIVADGELKVLKNGRKIDTIKSGGAFGELALLYGTKRNATVQAVTPCTCWALDRYTFRKILVSSQTMRLKTMENFLKSVPILKTLRKNELAKLAEALREETFYDKDMVMKEGDEDTQKFYLIWKGKAVVMKAGKSVGELQRGDYFGERALLKNAPRAATVIAQGDEEALVCLTLKRADFTALLGQLSELMSRSIVKQESTKTFTKYKHSVKREDPDIVNLKCEDLKPIVVMGKGAFGTVFLVKNIKNNKSYALKQVKMETKRGHSHLAQIKMERDIMLKLDNVFLIKLYVTFVSKAHLYFLLEPCMGGELFTILRDKGALPEDYARFYAACVIIAFEYMHSLDIIFRDLKPENLLIFNNGYIKVADFGFAKVIEDRTFTLCGTPDYLAPEVISGVGHGKGADWWAIGILLFEMVHAFPPFYAETPMQTYKKIMRESPKYPYTFTKKLKDLISKLLMKRVSQRLGVTKGGAAKIRAHEWFKKLDWEKHANLKTKPPMMPKIKSDTDCSNFDNYGSFKKWSRFEQSDFDL